MWPFASPSPTASAPPPPHDAPPPDSNMLTLASIVSQQEGRISEMRAEIAGLRREWDEVIDRINRWAGRENARKRRSIASGLNDRDAGPPEPGHGEFVGPEGSQGHPVADKNQLRALVGLRNRRG